MRIIGHRGARGEAPENTLGGFEYIQNIGIRAVEFDVRQLKDNALVVKDEGIGMNESELFLIFNRYFQADATQEGYGIGLSLVKAYCDHFKIPLSINSVKDKGTEVILDLSNLLIKT